MDILLIVLFFLLVPLITAINNKNWMRNLSWCRICHTNYWLCDAFSLLWFMEVLLVTSWFEQNRCLKKPQRLFRTNLFVLNSVFVSSTVRTVRLTTKFFILLSRFFSCFKASIYTQPTRLHASFNTGKKSVTENLVVSRTVLDITESKTNQFGRSRDN